MSRVQRATRTALQPVAQYLRVSTDMQEYSILHQREAIAKFASDNGMRVVMTYVDEAKSGVQIRGRSGLKQLIRDVHEEHCPFTSILVYDVSRWGRFQDTDESAYYEYVCKRAGAPVIYCAELFTADSTPFTAVMKSIKRAMAAEFSRELGDKVLAAKIRVAQRGFRSGAESPFGLQRVLVDGSGKLKARLATGDHKEVKTDRIVLTTGSQAEKAIVRNIFRWCVEEGLSTTEIADRLNRRKKRGRRGAIWTPGSVGNVLHRESYAGTCYFNRTTARLGAKRKRNSKDQWVQVPVQPTLVSREVFERANSLLAARRQPRYSDMELLEGLKKLLDERGYLGLRLIEGSRSTAKTQTYRRRFGSLYSAYKLVGYQPSFKGMEAREVYGALQIRRGGELRLTACRALEAVGVKCKIVASTHSKLWAGTLPVAVACRRPERRTGGCPSQQVTPYAYIALIGMLRQNDREPSSFHVIDHTGKRSDWHFDRLDLALQCFVARIKAALSKPPHQSRRS